MVLSLSLSLSTILARLALILLVRQRVRQRVGEPASHREPRLRALHLSFRHAGLSWRLDAGVGAAISATIGRGRRGRCRCLLLLARVLLLPCAPLLLLSFLLSLLTTGA